MSSDNDYDKLTKEEREARDKADREREVAEQSGMVPLNQEVDQIIDHAMQLSHTNGSRSWAKSISLFLFRKGHEPET
jgi:hypothetical protein